MEIQDLLNTPLNEVCCKLRKDLRCHEVFWDELTANHDYEYVPTKSFPVLPVRQPWFNRRPGTPSKIGDVNKLVPKITKRTRYWGYSEREYRTLLLKAIEIPYPPYRLTDLFCND